VLSTFPEVFLCYIDVWFLTKLRLGIGKRGKWALVLALDMLRLKDLYLDLSLLMVILDSYFGNRDGGFSLYGAAFTFYGIVSRFLRSPLGRIRA